MARVKINNFAGMRPVAGVDLLAPGEAQSAINTKLVSGQLSPFLGLAAVSTGLSFTGGPVQTIYRFGQSGTNELLYWFQSASDVDFVKGPVDGDTTERTYWTDGTYPKKTNATLGTSGSPYPTASLRIGIPAPTSAPTLGTPTGSGTPGEPAETRIYCMTYVSSWGEEGPPSIVSTEQSILPGQTQPLTALATAPGGAYDIVGKRLYRSATGSSSTKFQLVNSTDIPIATTTYNDTVLTKNLGDVLTTTGWVAPPDTMRGLTVMGNGVMAAFDGETVYFSEPGAPYAWPLRYRKSVGAPVVGIAAFDQSLFVGTTQGIIIFTGTDPATMSQEPLAVAQSLVSKRSVVRMLGGVVFATPDGLFLINSAGLKNLTEGLMDRTNWQAYVPSSIKAYEADNRYIAFYDTGSVQKGLIFTFGDTPTFCETDLFATAGYRDNKRDALYLVVSDVLKKWDAGSALSFDWTSGVFKLDSAANMSCARVDATAYSVTFKLYADGTLKHTQTVTDKFAFRLPSGYRSRRLHVQLTGTATIREVAMATSIEELISG